MLYVSKATIPLTSLVCRFRFYGANAFCFGDLLGEQLLTLNGKSSSKFRN
jgi:hypothetical protein